MEKYDPGFTPYTNNNLSWILGLHVGMKTIKHVEENKGDVFITLEQAMIFYNTTVTVKEKNG